MSKRYIPENSTELKDTKLGYSIYTYSKENKPFIAIAYFGKKIKSSWHLNFKSEENRSNYIKEEIKNCAAAAEEKKKIAEKKKEVKDKFLKELEVGQIFYSSWGYEQTNIQFYQIISKTGYTVVLKELEQEIVESGDMQGKTIGLKDKFADDKEYKKRVSSKWLKMSDYELLHKWDGTPKYYSSYH